MTVKNTTFSLVVCTIISLMLSCSSKKVHHSDLTANAISFVSNTKQIVGFGYVDVEALKEKSQISKVPELKKMLENTLGSIEKAVILKDKLFYAFAGPVKDNGPEVKYIFLNVRDKDDLQSLLETTGFYFKKSSVNPNLKIYDDESTALGFDDNTLILVEANFDNDPKELLLNAFASFNTSKMNRDVASILESNNDILLAVKLKNSFTNTESITKDIPEMKRSGIEELLKDGIWTLGIQLNKGNLIAKMDISKVNEQLKELYLLKDKGSEEIKQNLGPDSSIFAMTLSLNMDNVEGLMSGLKKEQRKELLNLLYAPVVVKALIASEGLSGFTNGNIGAMVSEKMDDEALLGMGLNKMNFFLGLGKSHENIIELMGTLAEADKILDLGDGYYKVDEGIVRRDENNLIYHANAISKEDFKTGPVKLDGDVSNFGEDPLSVYINLKDGNRNTMFYGMPETINYLFDYATLQGDNNGFVLRVLLKNKNENVLKQLFDAYKQDVIEQTQNIPVSN